MYKKNVQPPGIGFQMRTSENITGYTSTRQLVVLFSSYAHAPSLLHKALCFFFFFSFKNTAKN